jgi:hypothetical protein
MRTKTIAALSKSERGFIAERIPTPSPIIIQSTAPPKTSEAVTGAALPMSVLTDCSVT